MFTAIWEQVGESFAEYSDKLLFEGYNEILDDSPNQWYMPSSEAVPISNELNQIFVDTVRKTGGNNDKRNLICNTYCAGANKEITSGFVLPNDSADNRLIVETHIYQPFQFTSESYPDVTTWDSSALNMYVNNIYEQFVKNDIPVIIGEFGAASKNNNYDMMTWAKYYVTLCKGYGIPCIWWDNGSQYKIYNRRTLKVSNQELLNVMLAASKGEDYTINSGLAGDADNDGSVTLKDISLLESFILKSNDKLPSNCDLNKDNKINVIDLALLKNIYNENLSKEVNLCENEDNWSSWINTENGADGSMEYTENGIKLTVNSNGQYAWDEQVSYINLAIEKGAKYRIEFDYTSNQNVSNSFHIMQNYGSYTPYFSENLDYTPEVQHYKNIFTSSTDDNSVEIAFNCGNMTDDYPVTVTIENLKLIKLS